MRCRAALLVALFAVAVGVAAPDRLTADPPADAGTNGDASSGPPSCSQLQSRASGDALAKWLRAEGGVFDELLSNAKSYRVQVLTRELVRRDGAANCLVRRGYRADREYFYPASAIKTVAAVRALQFVNGWNADDKSPELGLDTVLWYRRPDNFDKLESTDFEWKRGGTLRQIVRRTLVVSNNHDFNRLFDLVGYGPVNRGLWRAGLDSVRLRHRMYSRRTPEEQKWSPAVAAQVGTSDDGSPERKTLHAARRSSLELPATPSSRLEVGESHTDFITGKFHEEPMDFSAKNYMSLDDMQTMMLEIFHPNALDDVSFSGLGGYRKVLRRVLEAHPSADSEKKQRQLVRRFSPLYPGVVEVLERDHIAQQNKAGRAYGFHIDNARIVNEQNGKIVFVAAAVYVNQDGEVNDNDYGYESKSYPFLRGVGRVVAKHLLK